MLPALLHFFWLLIQAFTAFSLMIPALFCLFYFAWRTSNKYLYEEEELHEEKDYAIIVPVCGPAENLHALLQSLAQLDYTNYVVYVAGNPISAADAALHNDKLVYLRTTRPCHPRFLHRFVIENFRRPHTHIAILSNDSLVDKNYLTHLNTFFNRGYQAVTSRQLFRNKAGIGNFLQSAIGSYHNFFAGKLLFSLGSSASVSCSGTAFTVHCYKQCLKTKMVNTGFTSLLQAKLARRNQQVAFASGAVVYKHVQADIQQLAGQHAQRVHDWLIGLLFSCRMIGKGIAGRSINQLLSGLSSLRMPVPTSVFIGLACFAVNLRIHPAAALLWAGTLLLLPVYMIVTAAQSFQPDNYVESGIQEEEYIPESIALYEQEEGYEAMMQTV